MIFAVTSHYFGVFKMSIMSLKKNFKKSEVDSMFFEISRMVTFKTIRLHTCVMSACDMLTSMYVAMNPYVTVSLMHLTI